MLNERQFILAKERFEGAGGRYTELGNGYVLSYDERLKVRCSPDCSKVIIGEAWQADFNRGEVEEELFACESEEQLFEAEYSFCGRYVIIFGDRIYTDHAASMGLFYGGGAVSNSYPLICKYLNKKVKGAKILRSFGMDFLGVPHTPVEGVEQLLASNVYDYVNSSLSVREMYPFPQVNGSKEELTELFIEYFTCSLKNMRKAVDGEFLVALTGGRDSRVLTALMERAGLDYRAYTLEHEKMSEADLKMPPVIEMHPKS